ncbi:MAG TPA: DUF6695 family protein [Sphingobacteriaceae bacterium]|nr:DUF6695 family protein [Sphingobacteriaceae bacterium]
MENTYNDLAIILAWPDATIRGDEGWMMFFRKLGLVKNLNFKVGHTGVILIDTHTSALLYYDFGRYISPRGLGRARSPFSDPRLHMRTKAKVLDRDTGEIGNLEEIVRELDGMQEATQGEGRLFFSVAAGLNFLKARQYADNLVLNGSTPYGAFARGNNNCSRFITRLLMRASKKYHRWHGVNLPESIKSSPISNVVNVRKDRRIFVYNPDSGLRTVRMNRFNSLFFMLRQLRDNFDSKLAKALPDDLVVGSVLQKKKPSQVPDQAQWLGGVGEGAWYHIQPMDQSELSGGSGQHEAGFEVSRYTEKGELEYSLPFYSEEKFDLEKPFHIAYDSHMIFTTVWQQNKSIRLYSSFYRASKPIGIIDFKPASQSVESFGLAIKD